MTGACSIGDCGAKVHARGWCSKHYSRWLRHGDPNKALVNRAPPDICMEEGCWQKHHAKGWCANHYNQMRNRDRTETRLCYIKGCDTGTKYYARGWCRIHYARWLRYGDPLQVVAPQSRDVGDLTLLVTGYVTEKVAADSPYVCMVAELNKDGSGWVFHHRLVMARSLGRPLRDNEQVHHINGDRADNRLSNLQLRNGNHGPGIALECLDCGSHNIEARKLAKRRGAA